MGAIVLDDDSEDDVPLFARPRQPVKKKGALDDSSSDDEPEWMKSFKSPQEIVDTLDDDDDDDDVALVTSPGKQLQFEMGSAPAKVVKSPPAGKEASKEDDEDEDEESADEEQQEEEKDMSAQGGGAGTASTDDDGGAAPAVTKRPAGRANSSTAAGGALPTPNRPGELPLLMPATLNRSKVFFECEGTGEAVDLEGDAGVVGRLLSDSSDKTKAGLQMDLKGVIYNAKILPTPASIVILTVNQTEAGLYRLNALVEFS
jgi:hypothetical protein